jgi:hypothetical protein
VSDGLSSNYDQLVRELQMLRRDLGMMMWTLGACTVLGRLADPREPDFRQLVVGAFSQFSLMREILESEIGSSRGDVQRPSWIQ